VQIGLVNFKWLKTLHVWVPWMAELSLWLQLLYVLAEEASGLRCIELKWGAKCELCCDIPLFKGSVAGLPLICTEGGALGYKSTGRSRIHDSRIIINSIN
jgi:hypothetical protein